MYVCIFTYILYIYDISIFHIYIHIYISIYIHIYIHIYTSIPSDDADISGFTLEHVTINAVDKY